MVFKENSSYPPEQAAYAVRVREILGRGIAGQPLAHVITFGCQQNVSDSERIKGMLCAMGYALTSDPAAADFIIFNTCAVREHAEDRVYGNVGAMKKYKRKNPNLILAVCGCMVQQQSVADRFLKSYPYVDILFGTAVGHRLPEFVYRRLTGGGRVCELSLGSTDIVEDVPVSRDGSFKCFIPVMYGCNNFCTYCIVPYVRGRERSRDPQEILREAREMIDAGYREIMLLGQNVNSYGKGEEHGVNFARLLRMINDIPGDFRIRFMTSHPKDCTEELLLAMRDCEKAERHLHLPVQSGSDRILKRMNRHYDRETYLKLISSAREKMPDIVFTSDIIVGFPGETEEDFEETLSLVKQVRYSSLFTFIYSPRGGTPAALMPDPVTRAEKGVWFSRLLAVQERISDEIAAAAVGRTFRVLCEEIDGDGRITAKTDGTASVSFAGDESLIGKLVNVRVDSYDGVLSGTMV